MTENNQPFGPVPQPAPPLAPHYFNQPIPNAQPPRKSKTRWVLPVALLVGGLIVGGAVGASGKPAAATPESCIKALDLADEGFSAAADAIGAATDGLTAASEFSSSGLSRASDDMEEASDEIVALAPKYKAAQQECRDSK